MQALRETTGGQFLPHTYLVDGTQLVAYIKSTETEPFYFKQPIKGFSRSGRRFESVEPSPFTHTRKATNEITITGSRGNSYTVNTDEKTCTCPGFQFRGGCRHLAAHG